MNQPSRRDASLAKARAAIEKGDADAAKTLLRPLTLGERADPEALFLMGVLAEREKSFGLAGSYAARSVEGARNPDALLLLARCQRRAGKTDACLAVCDELSGLTRFAEPLAVLRAAALEEAGRYDEAEAALDALLALPAGPTHPAALDIRGKLHIQRKRYAEAIADFDQLLARDGLPDEFRRMVLYAKAKAHDRAGQYAPAYESASAANRIGELMFDPELYEQQVTQLIETWSPANMAEFPISACDSELPVFVAGMPRSGTSLIDQIIDAHPQAAGVGELATVEAFAQKLSEAYTPEAPPRRRFGPYDSFRWTRAAREYVAHLAKISPPGSLRVVNKALGNNKLVGLIARLFPRTRIIHAVRDPRDVAVSCCMGGFNNRMHAWTTRPEWALAAWEQSARLMEHWKATLDVPILDVHYEKLVADPEREFPRLIEFLGLPWDDRCLAFHASRRTVRTLSYDQVNRPLYTSSVSRHRNYDGLFFPAAPADQGTPTGS
jgi:tetratricopeptide (TPR) repeat protein